MKDNITLLLLCCISSLLCNAQKYEVELPESNGFKINFSKTGLTVMHSIYINKKGQVSLEDIRLPVEQLGDSILKYRGQIPEPEQPFIKTFICADKNTHYINVEKVKSQISSLTLLTPTSYRTGHLYDIESGLTVKLNNKSLVPEKDPTEIIYTNPLYKMMDDLYDLKFSEAQEFLTKKKYKKVIFYSDRKLKVNDKKYKWKNKECIYKTLEETDFILVFSDPTMKYKTYLKNLSSLFKLYKRNKKIAIFIEISSDLHKIMKQRKIKF